VSRGEKRVLYRAVDEHSYNKKKRTNDNVKEAYSKTIDLLKNID